MATIIKQITIDAPADAVWDAVADFGAVHRRFAPGFVTDVELIHGARMVTFGDGTVAKELFLGRDDTAPPPRLFDPERAAGPPFAPASRSRPGGGKSRLTWTADVLPDGWPPTSPAHGRRAWRSPRRPLGRVPA